MKSQKIGNTEAHGKSIQGKRGRQGKDKVPASKPGISLAGDIIKAMDREGQSVRDILIAVSSKGMADWAQTVNDLVAEKEKRIDKVDDYYAVPSNKMAADTYSKEVASIRSNFQRPISIVNAYIKGHRDSVLAEATSLNRMYAVARELGGNRKARGSKRKQAFTVDRFNTLKDAIPTMTVSLQENLVRELLTAIAKHKALDGDTTRTALPIGKMLKDCKGIKIVPPSDVPVKEPEVKAA